MSRLRRYRPPTTSEVPPGKHVLVYDGACDFCRASAQFIQRYAREPVLLMSFAEVSGKGLLTHLDQSQIVASAHYITPDGKEYHGGESMTRALRLLPGGILFAVFNFSELAPLREFAYALVASNRGLFSRLTRPLWGRLNSISCSTRCPEK